jgi:hypothetical protein
MSRFHGGASARGKMMQRRFSLAFTVLILAACVQPQPDIVRRVVCLDEAHRISDLRAGILELTSAFKLEVSDQGSSSRDFFISSGIDFSENSEHETVSMFVSDYSGQTVFVLGNTSLSSREAAAFTNMDGVPSPEFDGILELKLEEFGRVFKPSPGEVISYGFCEARVD